MAYTPVSKDDFYGHEGVDDWRVEDDAVHAEFTASSFPAGGALVAAIADAAEEANHHPDIELHFPGRVAVSLTTHAIGGLSTHDVELARRISALAAEAGATPGPSASS